MTLFFTHRFVKGSFCHPLEKFLHLETDYDRISLRKVNQALCRQNWHVFSEKGLNCPIENQFFWFVWSLQTSLIGATAHKHG